MRQFLIVNTETDNVHHQTEADNKDHACERFGNLVGDALRERRIIDGRITGFDRSGQLRCFRADFA